MRILVAGGSGFIGRKLVSLLLKGGHEVIVYTHQDHIDNNLGFNDIVKVLTPSSAFPDADVIVNLSGERIDRKILTRKRINEIVTSRTRTIEFLFEKYKNRAVKHFIQASATGIYPDGDSLDESSETAADDYAEICKRVEEKAQIFGANSLLSLLRIGVVIGDGGGITGLLKYFPTLSFTQGNNYVPYIFIEDCARAICIVIEKEIHGPVNLCSDKYMTINEMLYTCKKKHGLKIILPKFLLKLDKRGALLLKDQKICPNKLLSNDFVFNNK